MKRVETNHAGVQETTRARSVSDISLPLFPHALTQLHTVVAKCVCVSRGCLKDESVVQQDFQFFLYIHNNVSLKRSHSLTLNNQLSRFLEGFQEDQATSQPSTQNNILIIITTHRTSLFFDLLS